LIINELVTNAIKHGFPDGSAGHISITARHDRGMLHICVQDNGVGIPESLDFSANDTLGVTLVRALTQQLNGVTDIDRTVGTRVSLSFPLPEDATLA
jgi:two-component sensor histidine kinase